MTETTYQPIGTIQIEDVAKKLEAIGNHEYPELLAQITAQPRLPEMVLFLQFMSRQPGGLVKFVADMWEQLPERFGTSTMRAAKRREYTLQEKRTILGELSSQCSPVFIRRPEREEEENWRAILNREKLSEEALASERQELEQFLKSWTDQEVRDICHREAAEILPRYLEDLCIQRDKGFTQPPDRSVAYWKSPYWLMDDPVAAVLEMMDRRVKEVSKRLATTAVTEIVFDALDFAYEERTTVEIVGNSRFGKTESLKGRAAMRPGLVRIVRVPSSNSLEDLIRAIAEALGITFSCGTRTLVLRERIRYIQRHCHFFLVLDECHYLVPQNYTKTTAPQRLNWVREEIMETGLPLALVHTPQTFSPDVKKFVDKTHFAMQQFLGRLCRVVQLPDELPRADLIAVARIHFPELSDEHLELIADLAELSENYLQTVEAVAKLARYIARREGHRRITVSDLEAAASEVIPRRPASTPDSALGDRQQPATKKTRGQTAAVTLKAPCKAPARELQPSRTEPAKARSVPDFSSRGGGIDRVEVGLLTVEA